MVDGQERLVESLSALRQIERESEQRHRNGEGAPLVWRDYSNDRSNFDRHTLAANVNQPMDGIAGGPGVKVDPSVFKVRKGSDVTKTHGTA